MLIQERKKVFLLANDTYANIFLNLVFQKYGTLPQEYQIMGFDNSPIANESIIPISTIGQQIDQISKTANGTSDPPNERDEEKAARSFKRTDS